MSELYRLPSRLASAICRYIVNLCNASPSATNSHKQRAYLAVYVAFRPSGLCILSPTRRALCAGVSLSRPFGVSFVSVSFGADADNRCQIPGIMPGVYFCYNCTNSTRPAFPKKDSAHARGPWRAFQTLPATLASPTRPFQRIRGPTQPHTATKWRYVITLHGRRRGLLAGYRGPYGGTGWPAGGCSPFAELHQF